MLEQITKFEDKIAQFTGAPYVIATDCCTHAIEIALRHVNPASITSSAFTYLSIPMLFHKLKIEYTLTDEKWLGQYQFGNTNVWDSAWLLAPNMYRKGQIQCLSFGNGKPIDAKRGGCILLDNKQDYEIMKRMSYDGRTPNISWNDEDDFIIGYHYNMSIEHSIVCSELLDKYISTGLYGPKPTNHRDCRNINIIDPLTLSK